MKGVEAELMSSDLPYILKKGHEGSATMEFKNIPMALCLSAQESLE